MCTEASLAVLLAYTVLPVGTIILSVAFFPHSDAEHGGSPRSGGL